MTLPNGWVEATIGEIADTKLGKMLDAAKNKGQPVPYLRNINVRWGSFDLSDLLEMRVTPDELDELTVRDGDLFVCEGGEPGRAAVWRGGEQRIVFQKALHRIRTLGGVEPDFVARYLGHAASNGTFADLLTGTTIKHLPQVALQRIPIHLPPLAEQRRIVAKLDALTTHLARARAELDRVPVLAARLRETTLAEAFSETNLTRWPSVSFDEVLAEGLIGLVRSKAEQGSDGTPYLRMNHFDLDGRINTKNLTHVRCSSEELRRFSLRPGDVLFNTRNSVELVGKVALWPDGVEGFVYNNNILRLRFDDAISPAFAFRYMMSPHFRAIMDREKSATTSVAAIYQRSLYRASIPVPAIDEQKAVVAKIETAFARAGRLEAEAARARALLDRLEVAILARAFRGELVPQDPADEPASVLLERIRAQRAATPKAKRGRKAKVAT